MHVAIYRLKSAHRNNSYRHWHIAGRAISGHMCVCVCVCVCVCRATLTVGRWLAALSLAAWQPCLSLLVLPRRWIKSLATKSVTASALKTAHQRERSSSTWRTACCWESFLVSRTLLSTGQRVLTHSLTYTEHSLTNSRALSTHSS